VSGSPSAPASRLAAAPVLLAWAPVVLLAAAAIVPQLRIPAALLVAGCAVIALRGAAGRAPTAPGVAWIAVLPIAVSLVVGLLPDPRVADPGACDDLLAPPVVRRVVQAGLVLGTVALLAPRLGGRRSLGLLMPPDRRVTALAAAAPLLVPVALVVGPILAGPFFGTVELGLPSAAALVPAVVLALANGVMEEVAYRGAAQRWGAPALGRAGAITAQAVMFGSAHLGADVDAFVPLLWAGMILAGLAAGVVADRTRSLLLPIAIHVAVDVPLALALTCRLA
jgi:membrane protease YdiL (CAAX protease family)